MHKVRGAEKRLLKILSCWVWVLMCRGGTDDYLQVAYARYLHLFESLVLCCKEDGDAGIWCQHTLLLQGDGSRVGEGHRV